MSGHKTRSWQDPEDLRSQIAHLERTLSRSADQFVAAWKEMPEGDDDMTLAEAVAEMRAEYRDVLGKYQDLSELVRRAWDALGTPIDADNDLAEEVKAQLERKDAGLMWHYRLHNELGELVEGDGTLKERVAVMAEENQQYHRVLAERDRALGVVDHLLGRGR